jgi:hypothetical protein
MLPELRKETLDTLKTAHKKQLHQCKLIVDAEREEPSKPVCPAFKDDDKTPADFEDAKEVHDTECARLLKIWKHKHGQWRT